MGTGVTCQNWSGVMGGGEIGIAPRNSVRRLAIGVKMWCNLVFVYMFYVYI